MTNMTIHPMQEADLPAVLAMIHALASHHGDTPMVTEHDLRRDVLGPHPWVEVIVAVKGTEVAGYAALCPLAQVQFGVRGMELHHLFVVRERRGTGVGRALLSGAMALCRKRGGRYMTVGTHPDNAAAAAFYRGAGFDDLPPPGPRFRMKF